MTEGRDPDSVGKLAARVARRIEAEVIARGWPVGEVLESEPVLRASHGVSRTVLREAARLLEHHQVARMRRGPGGGLVICAPGEGPAARAVTTYLDYLGVERDDVLQARRLLEPVVARLAAERISEPGIAELRRSLDAQLPAAGWAEPFHSVLSELTGNPALQLFIDILDQVTLGHLGGGARVWEGESQRRVEHARRRHEEIAEAVVSGDAPLAQARLVRHLDESARWLEDTPEADGWRRASLAASTPVSALLGPDATLAETIAARIYADIVGQGRPIGSVLGSEAELIARYETSRPVLRAAVRLLEHHSVAGSRRGPGGGLVVTRPSPRAAIDTTALYLTFRGTTDADLRVVREAIEVWAVARVTGRRDGHGLPDPLSDGAGFHVELAELSGNPVLSLFLRILIDLTGRRPAAGVPSCAGATDSAGSAGSAGAAGAAGAAASAEGVHGGILEAVRVGDAGLAQHRMRRHLAVPI